VAGQKTGAGKHACGRLIGNCRKRPVGGLIKAEFFHQCHHLEELVLVVGLLGGDCIEFSERLNRGRLISLRDGKLRFQGVYSRCLWGPFGQRFPDDCRILDRPMADHFFDRGAEHGRRRRRFRGQTQQIVAALLPAARLVEQFCPLHPFASGQRSLGGELREGFQRQPPVFRLSPA
jgi:hypothetical protein